MIEDTIPPQYAPRAPRMGVAGVIGGLAAAVLLGMALTLQVLGWGSVMTQANGRCGGRYAACPQGTTGVILLSILALLPLIPITGFAVLARLRRRDLVGRIVAIATVVLIPVGIWPGQAIYHWAHGTDLQLLWTASPEPSSRLEGQGSWLLPNAIVRARQDHLVSYDLATGRVMFTYTIPDPQLLCAMSRDTSSNVGLLAYGQEGGNCEHIVGLDLSSGRELWHQDLANAEESTTGGAHDFISISGDLAVVRAAATTGHGVSSRQGMQAFDLRTGTLRWHKELAGTCSFQAVGGSPSRVTTVNECVTVPSFQAPRPTSQITYSIQSYDPATGHLQWEAPMTSQGISVSIDPMSYSPLVVHVRETTTRGSDKILVIGDDGRTRTTIDAGGIGAPVRLDLTGHSSGVLPSRSYVIAQGTMVVVAVPAIGSGRSIKAFDLNDGHVVWSQSVGRSTSVQALTGNGDQVVTLNENSFQETLTSYRLRDGATHQIGHVHINLLTAEASLYAQGGLYAITDTNGEIYPPVAVLK